MKWIKDLFSPKMRAWEDFYRNRWQHDKVVRSTHGVNCTGGCSWNIYVKEGIVTWEMQALDYPKIDKELPPYEPRGCQRGISFSWYLYSPLRVKYPYVRGALLDLWREARRAHDDLPSFMSTPRPAMFVAMVTAPNLPAWAIISPSLSWFLAFRISCLMPSRRR